MKAITFSSYTNAYAIYVGTQSLGIETFTTMHHRTFPIPLNIKGTKTDWLFFTEESSLLLALRENLHGNFLPRHFPLNLLDDKWAFVEWLNSIDGLSKGLQQWSLAGYKLVEFPCLLKAKHSWVDSVKLPRGWICNSAGELEDRLLHLKALNLNPEHYFLQEWLGNKNCRVVSVCGFHDTNDLNRNLTAVVERIAAHTSGLSCTAVAQTIEDLWGLRESTSNILNALFFSGPYEMEYLIADGRAMMLELNPRFWMQHAIFLRYGNGLIKRYLGQDTHEDHQINEVKEIIWIDSIHLLISIFRMNFNLLKLVIGIYIESSHRVLLWPSVPMAIYVVCHLSLTRLRKKRL